MMNPAALAGAGMVTGVLGSLTQAYGQQQAGQAQAAQYQYQAGVAQVNQQIAQQNAEYAIRAGEVAAQQKGLQLAAQVGTTRAQQGASGLDVGTGSGTLVRAGEVAVGQEDIAVTRSNAAKQAYGYQVQAWQDTTQAQLYQMSAAQAKTAGDISAIGSLLGGASSVASKWGSAQSSGVFGGSGTSTG